MNKQPVLTRAFVFVASLLLAMAFVFIAACESLQKTEPLPANWATGMQGLADGVRELIPYVYNRDAYFDPRNKLAIEKAWQKFSDQSHKINPEMGEAFFGDDPILKYSLNSMESDIERARAAFRLGRLDYSRGVAKNVMNHCFRCHSVVKEGGAAPWAITGIEGLSLNPVEKAELLVATRKYDEAFSYLENVIADKDFVQNYPFDFEGAVRKYLAVVIRIDNRPDRPLVELDKLVGRKEVPFYLRQQVEAWRQSLLTWSQEKPSSRQGTPLTQAKRRIERAREVQSFAKDHAGDVEYLRATSLLHEHLKFATEKNQSKQEAYFLLGESYSVLDELGYWNLHEIYFESCIRANPKTALARKCYSRLESSVYFGYSGSGGVRIPPNERRRLNELKDLIH